MRAAVRDGLRFGGLAFLAGAALGPARELVLAPRLGGVEAAWVEAVAMAGLLWLAAGWALSRTAGLRDRAATAAIALVVVLVAEAALTTVFVMTGIAASRAPRGLAEQLPGLLLLGWLVALPFRRP